MGGAWVHYHSMHVQVRGQLYEAGPLLPPSHEPQELNSGGRAYSASTLTPESSCWPHFLVIYKEDLGWQGG